MFAFGVFPCRHKQTRDVIEGTHTEVSGWNQGTVIYLGLFIMLSFIQSRLRMVVKIGCLAPNLFQALCYTVSKISGLGFIL